MEVKIQGFSSEKSNHYQYALNLRSTVLVQEYGLDKHLEFDGKDNDAMHYIVYCNMVPAGCARWTEEKGKLTIDRFCVKKDYRRKGLAVLLIRFIVSELLPSKKDIHLLALTDSFIFFTQAGFKDTGEALQFGNKRLRILKFANG